MENKDTAALADTKLSSPGHAEEASVKPKYYLSVLAGVRTS
jgi:hypothetical protein